MWSWERRGLKGLCHWLWQQRMSASWLWEQGPLVLVLVLELELELVLGIDQMACSGLWFW